MPLYGYRGKTPKVAPDAFIAPTAVLIGDVTVESGASVWFGTVLRGDMDRTRPDDRLLIGQAAVLVGGNVIGEETIVGAGAVLPEKFSPPPRSLVLGVPARVVREARPEDARWTVRAAEHYTELGAWYRENLK